MRSFVTPIALKMAISLDWLYKLALIEAVSEKKQRNIIMAIVVEKIILTIETTASLWLSYLYALKIRTPLLTDLVKSFAMASIRS